MHRTHHSPDQPLDMPTKMRASRRAIDQIDPPFCAGRLKGTGSKIAAIVDVNAVGLSLRGPRDITLEVGQKLCFGGDGPREAQSHRKAGRRFKADVVSRHHARGDVDRQGHPRPADGFALETVDKDDVRWCVIDLHNGQRSF